MAEDMKVLGIYLERTGATLLRAEAALTEENASNGLDPWNLRFGDARVIQWNPNDSGMVKNGIQEICTILKNLRDDIQGVGVASYGPFESLTPPSRDLSNPKYTFAKIREDTAHPPLNGLNLDNLLKEGLGIEWYQDGNKKTVIQTDAGACALGEAYFRSTRIDQTLAFLCVTQGVGLGIVQGRKVLNAALHPEVGLLPAFPREGDPIATGFVDNRPQLSIAQLASNGALKRRFQKIFPDREGTFSDITNLNSGHFSKEFWRHRAFYVAQACIACTVIIPPDVIVIGAPIDPFKNIDGITRYFLREQLKGLQSQGQPVFDYGVLLTKDFLSTPSHPGGINLPEGLATIGAAGLCYAAADEARTKRKE